MNCDFLQLKEAQTQNDKHSLLESFTKFGIVKEEIEVCMGQDPILHLHDDPINIL